ncbi:MAG: hypothetical protein ABSF35_07080 [Polyangia bacterium]
MARTKQALDAVDPANAQKKWARAAEVVARVEKVRLQSRLYLGDLSDAVHLLILTPRIAQHCAKNPERQMHVIPLATQLRETIERTLRTAYVEGRFPSASEARSIATISEEFSNFFSESKDWEPLEPPDAG